MFTAAMSSRLVLVFLLTLFAGRALPAEEFRAAWVASVVNLNFPSKAGLSAEQQQEEIRRIVGVAADRGLNALMVQVRPEGDALYVSRFEPWSRYLTGTQGAAPGYDPLAAFIAEGNRRGVAIHAWLNPYRAALNGSLPRAETHLSRRVPGAVRRVGNKVWLDPSDTTVRGQVLKVVQDLLSRYAVAGIVLDDYFYPYPGSGLPRGTFPDEANYERYRAAGGNMERGDWRRANVNALIRDIRQTIHATRPGARFGVSPFGIYRPQTPAGVEAGVDMYADS
jgi:uncharacterized lipoprotein YddW (UPF0748 family)